MAHNKKRISERIVTEFGQKDRKKRKLKEKRNPVTNLLEDLQFLHSLIFFTIHHFPNSSSFEPNLHHQFSNSSSLNNHKTFSQQSSSSPSFNHHNRKLQSPPSISSTFLISINHHQSAETSGGRHQLHNRRRRRNANQKNQEKDQFVNLQHDSSNNLHPQRRQSHITFCNRSHHLHHRYNHHHLRLALNRRFSVPSSSTMSRSCNR